MNWLNKAKTKQILSCAAAKQFGVHKKQHANKNFLFQQLVLLQSLLR